MTRWRPGLGGGRSLPGPVDCGGVFSKMKDSSSDRKSSISDMMAFGHGPNAKKKTVEEHRPPLVLIG